MTRPNFNKIEVQTGLPTADISIADGVVYGNNLYPKINHRGWSITRYPDKKYRISPLTGNSHDYQKYTSFKKATDAIYRQNHPAISIDIAALISGRPCLVRK